MSKVLIPQKSLMPQSNKTANNTTPISAGDSSSSASSMAVDLDDFTASSSILDFLTKEQECCSDADAESIFQEVSRLADDSDTRSVDEILREAELLIQKQTFLGENANGTNISAFKSKQPKQNIKMNAKYTKRIENVRPQETLRLLNGHCSPPIQRSATTPLKSKAGPFDCISPVACVATPQTPIGGNGNDGQFAAFIDNLPSVSVISEESTPKDMQTFTATEKDATTITQLPEDDTDDGSDTMEEITEAIETIELVMKEDKQFEANNANDTKVTSSSHAKTLSASMSSMMMAHALQSKYDYTSSRRPSSDTVLMPQSSHLTSPTRRAPLNFNATQACSPSPNERRNSGSGQRSSMTTPDSGISQNASTNTPRTYSPLRMLPVKTYCDKSVNPSPKHMVSSLTSPIKAISNFSREHALKQDIDQLQEKLKDTEERLQSLRIQHDSLSQLHRDLRESNTRLQEESEVLKLDVQHLNECANILRTELQSARTDRIDALDVQKILQTELKEARQEKKFVQDQKEKETKTIQDLQRQCREMERILMRKHPDSVSALIVAAKNSGANNDPDNLHSRKLLEQRIAQLESDAKEQDKKAQQILANVQARFNSVQSKYETHIADLEMQVLSLQDINTKLNEKIESQVRTLDYFVTQKAEKFYNNCTQTDEVENEPSTDVTNVPVTVATGTQTPAKTAATRDHSTNTIGLSNTPLSASSSTSSTANSTPSNSRPNSKQSGLRRPALNSSLASKLPVSQSDSTIAVTARNAIAGREDAHLLATIRGMRVDLAMKDKAVQRLTRELDECKRTIKKLNKEKDVLKLDRPQSGPSAASTSRRGYYDADHTPASTDHHMLKEAHNKIKLLEADYKTLHEKRMQDLKTLQSAHERELNSFHETVRILQQRLNERDEAFAMQKRRKVPVDYYALKAKVSSLERRHSEREDRLHILVEALSKGRFNGALEELLSENNNQ